MIETVSLQGKKLAPETLNRIPKKVAQEFQAVFFDETENELKLGIVDTKQLKSNIDEALKVLQKQVGKKITLYQISQADFIFALKQYDQKPASNLTDGKTVEVPGNPPIYTKGVEIADATLLKIPLDFARKRHLIAVDFAEPNTYWLATDRLDETQKIAIDLMARRNRIKLNPIQVDGEEFKRLLRIREAVADMEAPKGEAIKNKSEKEEEVEINKKTEAEMQKESGITAPLKMGRIVSGEVEQSGLAGLLQKASSVFGSSNAVTGPGGDIVQDTEASPNSKNQPSQDDGQAIDRVVESGSEEKDNNNNNDKGERKLSVPKVEVASIDTKKVEEETPSIKNIGIASIKDEDASSISKDVAKIFKRAVTDVSQLQTIVRQGSVPRIVAGIINYAVDKRSSDIHIEPYEDELLIRYRIDGQLSEILKLPMEIHPAVISRVKILSKLKLDEQRIPQDGRFDVVVSGDKEIDIRVSTLPTVHGEKIVMRLLNKSDRIYSLEKLGLVGDGLQRLVDAIKQPYGVVLATGPTGSGKTTTLYAILQRVATGNVNIITLEDPVEYEIKGINQSQIKPKIGFTFADGLRSVLRQDPNIIMVGEVRDSETASMMTHAALTGHLVLSTLHTNNAAGALPRLINMGVEPFLLTSAMNAVVGQRLVRQLCNECKEEFELTSTIRKEIDKELELIKANNSKDAARIPNEIKFYRQKGCDKCRNGYLGRLGLFEVLHMSDEIEDLAVKKAPAFDIERVATKAGMITLKQDGILKVLEGLTTLDEVLRETSER